ncbi:MAG: Fic family protein [Bifidobacteriaceae bacterium]|jgi:Fic family protein|nr:Fic family protein [Bifidobacteriaceae bacterium]
MEKTFNYAFLARGELPTKFVPLSNIVAEQKSLNSYREGTYPDIFSHLENIARLQSVKESNAIEGIITNDERLNQIITGTTEPLNHDEMEIAGYRDALDTIHQSYTRLDVSEINILNLHRQMLTYTMDGGGAYKQGNNLIVAVDDLGNRKTRFTPVSAEATPRAMEQLTLAYFDARSRSDISPLLLIPCYILDFLCIHPFGDGNGRMSRLLSLLLLYRSGYDIGKYISFEAKISKFKTNYYQALKESSENWHTNQNDYFPFMYNFLQTLVLCYKDLDQRFAHLQGERPSKKVRIEQTLMNSLTPMSKKDMQEVWPDLSISTIEAVLGAMLKAGKIEKIGAARSTKYIRKLN